MGSNTFYDDRGRAGLKTRAKGWEKIRSTVEIDLTDGRTLVEHADERYRGGPDLPFTGEFGELVRVLADTSRPMAAAKG